MAKLLNSRFAEIQQRRASAARPSRFTAPITDESYQRRPVKTVDGRVRYLLFAAQATPGPTFVDFHAPPKSNLKPIQQSVREVPLNAPPAPAIAPPPPSPASTPDWLSAIQSGNKEVHEWLRWIINNGQELLAMLDRHRQKRSAFIPDDEQFRLRPLNAKNTPQPMDDVEIRPTIGGIDFVDAPDPFAAQRSLRDGTSFFQHVDNSLSQLQGHNIEPPPFAFNVEQLPQLIELHLKRLGIEPPTFQPVTRATNAVSASTPLVLATITPKHIEEQHPQTVTVKVETPPPAAPVYENIEEQYIDFTLPPTETVKWELTDNAVWQWYPTVTSPETTAVTTTIESAQVSTEAPQKQGTLAALPPWRLAGLVLMALSLIILLIVLAIMFLVKINKEDAVRRTLQQARNRWRYQLHLHFSFKQRTFNYRLPYANRATVRGVTTALRTGIPRHKDSFSDYDVHTTAASREPLYHYQPRSLDRAQWRHMIIGTTSMPDDTAATLQRTRALNKDCNYDTASYTNSDRILL